MTCALTAVALLVLVLAGAAALPPWQVSLPPLAVTLAALALAQAVLWWVAWPAAAEVCLGARRVPGLTSLARAAASLPGVVVGLVALDALAPRLGLGIGAGCLALGLYTLPYAYLLAQQAFSALDEDFMEACQALALPTAVVLRLAEGSLRPQRRQVALHVAGRTAGETAVWYLTAGVAEHAWGWAAWHAGAASVATRLYYLLQTGGETPRARFLLATLVLFSLAAEYVALAERRAARSPAVPR